jgi:predicted patatin/cPLA2 family phospholipase
MNASCAMPFVHNPIRINGIKYIDGGLSDPLPVHKAITDGYTEIVAVYNKPAHFYVGRRFDDYSKFITKFLPNQISKLIKDYKSHVKKLETELASNNNIKVIRPNIQLPLTSILDTNKSHLNAAINLGVKDAHEFIKTLSI